MIPYIAGLATGLVLGGIGCLVVFTACAEALDEERARHATELQDMADALLKAGRRDRLRRTGTIPWNHPSRRN